MAALRCFTHEMIHVEALRSLSLASFACATGWSAVRSVFRLGLSGHGPVECGVITGLVPWRRALLPEKVSEIKEAQRTMGKWDASRPAITIGIVQGKPVLYLLGGSHAAIASVQSGIPTAMYDFKPYANMEELLNHPCWQASARMLIFIREYSLLQSYHADGRYVRACTQVSENGEKAGSTLYSAIEIQHVYMVRMQNMRLHNPNQTHEEPEYKWRMNAYMKRCGWVGPKVAPRRKAIVDCAAKCVFGENPAEFHKELMTNVERVQKVRAYLLRLPPHADRGSGLQTTDRNGALSQGSGRKQ